MSRPKLLGFNQQTSSSKSFLPLQPLQIQKTGAQGNCFSRLNDGTEQSQYHVRKIEAETPESPCPSNAKVPLDFKPTRSSEI